MRIRTRSVLAAAIFFLVMPSSALAEPTRTDLPPTEYAERRLRDAGVSSDFISVIKATHRPEERDKIVELNVLGFLGKANYSGHFSARAVRKCQQFVLKHSARLKGIEASTGVPKEVIAALLWVETKHGKRTGSYNVPHVFFSLLQADHPDVVKATLTSLVERETSNLEENRQKVVDRSVAKANWALGELRSLDEIYHKRQARDLSRLTGSFAGAFGIPQFIPSSYVQWARPNVKTRPAADLFRVEDAMQSVAYYLKSNGWKRGEPASHQEALYHYNRAQGYVDVILKIAKHVKTAAKPKARKANASQQVKSHNTRSSVASGRLACFG